MAVQPFYATGTATVTSGSATVTGTGTAWTIGVVNGGIFSRNGFSIPITSIGSNTSLTLAYPWPGTTGTGPCQCRGNFPQKCRSKIPQIGRSCRRG
ncbi:MAG: hypothetical protein V7704_19470, partial [Aurantimonas endophytica]